MKITHYAFIALATAAGSVFAQTNLTIYGVADAGVSYRDNGAATNAKTWGVDSGQHSSSRLGFRGTEDLGGGLSAIFTLENGFSIDNGTLGQGGRLYGRQAWVGINSNFGTIKLGRQNNPIRSALELVDPFAFASAGSILNVFNAYGERADNTINYAIPTIAGFSGQIAYSLGEIAGNSSAGRQLGLSAGYSVGSLNLIVAYHDQNLLTATSVPSGDAKTTMLGGTYDARVVKAHAAYGVNKGASSTGIDTIDSRDMMIGVSAPVGAGNILASYIRRDDKLVANRDSSQWALGYTYNLSKRTNLYTFYSRIKNDRVATIGNGTIATGVTAGNDPSIFTVGVRHRF